MFDTVRSRVVFAAASALVLVFSIAAPATAAQGQVFRFSSAGNSAEAFFTTFPLEGEPQARVVYTDTFLFAADEVITEDGEEFPNKFAFVDVFSFKFDNKGNFIFVSETFGSASGDAVDYTQDKDLTSAALTATFDLVIVTCTRRGCTEQPAGTGTASVSWTGQGQLIREVGNFKVGSKTFTETGHFNGKRREASAAGTVLGTTHDSVFASMFDGRFSDRFICHGC